MSRRAVIDLGTNTFNLVVVEEIGSAPPKIIYEEELPVRLGAGSLRDGILKPDAIGRAIRGIKKHLDTASQYQPGSTKIFATSAVRNASNKADFLERVKNECNIEVEVVSGDREAELIYIGTKHALSFAEGINYLILDIGGGSNEFILCDHTQVLWKKSYDLGIARLIEQLSPSDPLGAEDIEKVKQTTDKLAGDLDDACDRYKPKVLIGASGSFETFLSMIMHIKHGNDDLMKQRVSYEINMEDFYKLHDNLVMSTSAERHLMKGLPAWRADMIVLAAVFTRYVVQKYDISRILFSGYALKEGAAFERK